MATVKKMTLSEWIEHAGGATKVAKALNVAKGAVNHWKRGYILPKDEMKLTIKKHARGRLIDFDTMLERHYSPKNKNRWNA